MGRAGRNPGLIASSPMANPLPMRLEPGMLSQRQIERRHATYELSSEGARPW